MSLSRPNLGIGIGWRPELALAIERRRDLGFVELTVADASDFACLPTPVEHLRHRRVQTILHGVSLSLGSAEPVDREWLRTFAALANRCGSALVSEHIAFVRGGGLETGHLLPVPRTRAALAVVVENVRAAQAVLPVPLALENIASLIEWPDAELDEAAFLTEILEQTDSQLLLDIENVYANAFNHGYDAVEFLERIPLERIAYVHIAGGIVRDGLYHDTHAHPVPVAVLHLLEELCARTAVPGVMLEWDDCFPSDVELNAVLDAIATAAANGAERRLHVHAQ